jgi:hypothetical protein
VISFLQGAEILSTTEKELKGVFVVVDYSW